MGAYIKKVPLQEGTTNVDDETKDECKNNVYSRKKYKVSLYSNVEYLVILISVFYSTFSKKHNRYVPGGQPCETDIYTFLEEIKFGHYKQLAKTCSEIEDKEERTKYKAQNAPAVTISCTCNTWRKLENISSYSCCLNIDIDDTNNCIDNWCKLRDYFAQQPYVVAAFLSISGKGLSVIFKINPEKHYDTFKFLIQELKKIGINADTVVHDVVRLRFASYDPDAYINYDFENIPIIEPTEEYYEEQKKKQREFKPLIATGAANSLSNFRNAVTVAEREYTFTDGQKHYFLVCVAGYCNTTGMDEEVCCSMVLKHYREFTTISDEDLLQPIRNVYNRYKHQFGETPLKQHKISRRVLRWLLTYIEKSFLRKHIEYFGLSLLIGETNYRIKVSSKLLCFFMWLACPEYTWTIAGEYDQEFTDEDCKNIIPENALLDSCNDCRVWICKTNRYPLNWK